MKIKIRRSCQTDLDSVYDLHKKCFKESDCWYKSNIRHYLDKGIIVESIKEDTKKVIGILLQGFITPCNKKYDCDENIGTDYNEDQFDPVNETGKYFLDNNIHFKELYGIVMVCVDPDYRNRGIAKKLIKKHFQDNPNKLLCLNTRRSNINAYSLYKKIGYEHIAFIKNKYFLPTEDSIFMIYQ